MLKKNKNHLAFTIVELLIVIVIIGILAAITIVSYRGITQRATEATLQADLSNASKKIKLYFADHGVYPATMDPDGKGNYCPTGPTDANYCIKPSGSNTFIYNMLSAGQDFGLVAKKGLVSYRVTKDTGPFLDTIVSASFAKTWGGTGGETGGNIVSLNDGGYAISGQTSSYAVGSYDSFLAKYDLNGNLIWNKTWGGSAVEFGIALIQTNDDGFAVVGNTASFGAGNDDVFLSKYDMNGNLVWNKTWGGTLADGGVGVIQTNDNGYVLTGNTASYGSGSTDAFVLKFDSSGNLVWNKTWGGANIDYSQGIVKTNDGGFAVTGYTEINSVAGDLFISKYDANGNVTWNKTWAGPNTENGQSIIQTNDGGYAVSGYTGSYGAGDYNILLIKYDSSGNLVWNKIWGGTGSDVGRGISQASDGGYVLIGYTDSYGAGLSDMVAIKYDINGNFLWNKTWGGAVHEIPYSGHSIDQSSDGGYVTVGYSSSYGSGASDILVLKFKTDGTINNCTSPMCQSPTATVTSPSASVSSPLATVTVPSATVTSPSATVMTPSATTTTVVAP